MCEAQLVRHGSSPSAPSHPQAAYEIESTENNICLLCFKIDTENVEIS